MCEATYVPCVVIHSQRYIRWSYIVGPLPQLFTHMNGLRWATYITLLQHVLIHIPPLLQLIWCSVELCRLLGCWKLTSLYRAFYIKVDTLEGPLMMAFLQNWGLQGLKLCTQMQMKHEMFGLDNVCSSEGCEIWWIGLSEGLGILSMSLAWPSVLEAKEYSVEIVYECLEDMRRLPRVMILNISLPVVWAYIACLDLSIENQKGGCIKQNQIISLNTISHKWHLYCLSLPPHSPYFLHSDRGHRSGQGHKMCGW